jgi:hypothetical protein
MALAQLIALLCPLALAQTLSVATIAADQALVVGDGSSVALVRVTPSLAAPTNFEAVGRLDLHGAVSNVAALPDGSAALAAVGARVYVLSVKPPLRTLGSFAVSGVSAGRVRAQSAGTLVFVCVSTASSALQGGGGDGALEIWDIADVRSGPPRQVGSLTFAGRGVVDVLQGGGGGGVLFVSTSAGLSAVNASDPSNAVELWRVPSPTGGGFDGISLDPGTSRQPSIVWAAADAHGVVSIDVATGAVVGSYAFQPPYNKVWSGSVALTSGGLILVAADPGLMIMANGGGGHVVNGSSSSAGSSASIAGACAINSPFGSLAGGSGWNLEVVGSTAYLADQGGGLQVVDVAVPASPRVVWHTGKGAQGSCAAPPPPAGPPGGASVSEQLGLGLGLGLTAALLLGFAVLYYHKRRLGARRTSSDKAHLAGAEAGVSFDVEGGGGGGGDYVLLKS